MISKISKFFEGHSRTVKAKKNIIISFIIKGISIVVGFLMVRVVLNYLDPTKYGIWLTLTSFLTWFTFFEIGLGNGLKNKLAEALAKKDYKLGRIYVSTTYAILAIIVSILALLFFSFNSFIDWTKVLNTNKALIDELSLLSFIVFGFFFLRFVIKLISIVLYADQRSAMANAFGPIGNLTALILIYILTLTTEPSLVYLGLVMSVTPVIVLILASYYFYKTEYKNLAPSIKYVNFKYANELFGLGIKFFIIQIAGLIIYQSSNIIIAQYFGPSEVTIYNIGHKYFSMIIMMFAIITTPFWSAFTEAWIKKDVVWIKSSIQKLCIVWGLLVVLGLVMLFFSNEFYHLWVGDSVIIPFKLSLVLFIYCITFTFGNIFGVFINGVGKIKLQMYSTIISAIMFILIALVLIVKFNMGIIGIVVASVLSNFYGLILAPIQYKKIINNKAKGIWAK